MARFLLLTFLLLACNLNGKNGDAIDLESGDEPHRAIESGTHRWFAFSGDDFEPVNDPQSARIGPTLAWTEAVRVDSAVSLPHRSYFLANRLGLVALPDSPEKSLSLFSDTLYFANRTESDLRAVAGVPVFRAYRNRFFNADEHSRNLPFLLKFKAGTQTFYPVLSATDLGIDESGEAVSLCYDGEEWIAAFKNPVGDKIHFDYVSFSLSESVATGDDVLRIAQIPHDFVNQEEFLAAASPKNLVFAPEGLISLLSDVASQADILVSHTDEDGCRTCYMNDLDSEDFLSANSAASQSATVAVFEDGTSFFAGRLGDSPFLQKSFKLPEMGENFVYSSVALCGKMLYAGWEERFFYDVRRSGFLAVDLDKIFL